MTEPAPQPDPNKLPDLTDEVFWRSLMASEEVAMVRIEEIVEAFQRSWRDANPRIFELVYTFLLNKAEWLYRVIVNRRRWTGAEQDEIVEHALFRLKKALLYPGEDRSNYVSRVFWLVAKHHGLDAIRHVRSRRRRSASSESLANLGVDGLKLVEDRIALDQIRAKLDSETKKLAFDLLREGTTQREGMTQQEVADIIGVHQSQISRWMSGIRKML